MAPGLPRSRECGTTDRRRPDVRRNRARAGSRSGLNDTRATATQIRLYVAISIDGFIADANGSVAWLNEFPPVPVAFARFIEDVGTIVSGRTTYEHGRDLGWPSAPQTIVVTSRPLEPAPNVRVHDGPLADLIASLRARQDGRDVWVIGGGRLMAAFLDAGAIDRIIVFVVPYALGAGTPLFAGLQRPHGLRFVSAGPHGDAGIIRLIYEPRTREG